VLWVDADVYKKYGDSFFRGTELWPSESDNRIQFWWQTARKETKSEPSSQETTYSRVEVSWNIVISQQWTWFTGNLIPLSSDIFKTNYCWCLPAVPCDDQSQFVAHIQEWTRQDTSTPFCLLHSVARYSLFNRRMLTNRLFSRLTYHLEGIYSRAKASPSGGDWNRKNNVRKKRRRTAQYTEFIKEHRGNKEIREGRKNYRRGSRNMKYVWRQKLESKRKEGRNEVQRNK